MPPTPWTCSAGFLPALPHGNIRLSQVPELSLCVHAMISDPGGVPFARHIATGTAAFRWLDSSALAPLFWSYPLVHNYTYFGIQ